MSPNDDGAPIAEATVDAASCVVEVGGRRWPFAIDLATGALSIVIDGQSHTVEPLSWREKTTLARYARAPSGLVDAALLRHRLGGADPLSGDDSTREELALVALARWLNGLGPYDGGTTLDPVRLAAMAAAACRESGATLAELAALPAAEVELIAATATVPARVDQLRAASGPASSLGSELSAEPLSDGLTRIVIVPDPVPSPAESGSEPDTGPGDPGERAYDVVAAGDDSEVRPVAQPANGATVGLVQVEGPSSREDLPFLSRPHPAREADPAPGQPDPSASTATLPSARTAARTVSPPLAPAPHHLARRSVQSARGARPSPRPRSAGPHDSLATAFPAVRLAPTDAPHTDVPAASPAPPVVSAPARHPAPDAATTPASDLDAVLIEVARRLEQAVDDLGLDPEG